MDSSTLTARLQANLAANNGSLVLPDATIAVENLDWFLQQLVKSSKVQVTGAAVTSNGLGVSGKLSLFGVGLDVTANFVPGATVALSLNADLDGDVAMGQVVNHFYSTTEAPEVSLSTLTLKAATADKTFSVSVGLTNGTETLALGSAGLTITGVSGSVDYAGGLKASFGLSATIGSLALTLEYAPPGDLTLTGTAETVPLGDALDAFLQDKLALPGAIPAIVLTDATVTVKKDGSHYQLSLSTQVDGWGALEFDVWKKGSWIVAAGFALEDAFGLDTIDSELGAFALDGAKLKPAALVIASASGDNPFSSETLKNLALVKGVAFNGGLTVSSASGALSKALEFFDSSEATLDISGSIATPLSDTYLEITYEMDATLPETAIHLMDPSLRFTLAPSVQVHGNVLIPIDDQSITLKGGFAITTTEAVLFVNATFPKVDNPVKFQGITLEQIGGALGFTFAPPGGTLTLAGEMLIGDNRSDSKFAFSILVQPEAVAPKLLSCAFTELDLPTMMTALAPGASTPNELDDINFRDFSIYWAATDTLLPDGTQASAGFGFNSEMSFFGWTAYAMLDIEASTGFKGQADLSPISLGGGAFSFTGNGSGGKHVAAGGPTVDIDTSSKSFSFSAAADLLGVKGSAEGKVAPDKTSFSFASSSYGYLDGDVSGSLSSNLSNPSLAFAAAISSTVVVSTARLKFPGTDYYFGKININGGFSGSFNTRLNGASFTLDSGGSLRWEGKDWAYTLPSIHKQPKDLSNLATLIGNGIADEAQTLFAPLWNTAEKYVAFVAKAVITEIDPDPVGMLESVYGVSAEAAVKLLKTLEGVIPHVDQVIVSHVDTPKVPHGDTTLTPHADGKKWGIHGDIPKTHGDTGFIPHVDTGLHADI